MARTSNKDRDANEMVMGTFRVKSGMWEQFKQLATENGATATDLIISFIENCLQSQAIPQSIQGTDKSPQSNLDDIYTYIDNKLDKLDIQSRQGIDITNLDSVYTYIDNKLDKNIDTSVKKLITDSLEDGEVGEAIAKCYSNMMGQFNELLIQMEELKAAIPPAVAPCSQSPVTSSQSPDTSHQSPVTSQQSPVTSPQSPVTSPQSPVTSLQLQITEEQKLDLIELLGIKEIVGGEVYYKQYLLKNGIDDRIKTNTKTLENLGIKFNGNQRQPVAKLNFILVRLGYRTKNIGQKTIGDARGIECYQVLLP